LTIKCKDTLAFILGSLKNLCEDFKVPDEFKKIDL